MKINLLFAVNVLLLSFISEYTLYAQSESKFEYGIGIVINHSSINEDYRTNVGPIEGLNKGIRLPAITTRLAYKLNDRFHLNSGPGFSWLGALLKDQSARIVATTFELPALLEWNPKSFINLSGGPVYNYVIGIISENDQLENDLISTIDSRHQLGLRIGIAYSHKSVELILNYSHYMTDLFAYPLVFDGIELGTYISKFRNIQLGVIFRT